MCLENYPLYDEPFGIYDSIRKSQNDSLNKAFGTEILKTPKETQNAKL